jgi:hypothetical protein
MATPDDQDTSTARERVRWDRLSRRDWLLGSLLGLTGGSTALGGQVPAQGDATANEANEIARVQAEAQRAGLKPFGASRTEHFLGLGDAPADFVRPALNICEEFAKPFLASFRQHGFPVSFPQRRLTVVMLKDSREFGAYIGKESEGAVGGHYDLATNQLVVFDYRAMEAQLAADARRVNLFALIHETAHLLSFNTGLLSQASDVPACISEGLATYLELWRRGDRSPLGATNRPRLAVLVDAKAENVPWIPIAELFGDDDRFDQPATEQLAYAESWLLVHYLLKTTTKLPKFRAYCAEIPQPGGAGRRVEYAESRLGSLRALNQDVRAYARRFRRR